MFSATLEKERQLEHLAQTDKTYLMWKNCYEKYTAQFEAFAKEQPEEIANFLWGYAESGRLMQQRKVNLACENMEFAKK